MAEAAQSGMNNIKYMPRIEKDNQRYYLMEDGTKLPSVTSILSVIAKPGILKWAMRKTLEHAKAHLDELSKGGTELSEQIIDDILSRAKKSPEELTAEAMSTGSRVHHIIELFFKDKIAFHGIDMRTEPEKVRNSLSAFFGWMAKTRFALVDSELTVFSKKHCYAGTLDAVGKVKGKLALIDFKTSNAVYEEHYAQVAAYKTAYEEMTGAKVQRLFVVRFGKDDGRFEAVKVTNQRAHLKAFMGAKAIWEWKHAS